MALLSYRKKIVCLANSRKYPHGRCIAGRKMVDDGYGDWVRPVSNREKGELTIDECRYQNGSEPRILDIIEIPFLGIKPKIYQEENQLIDPTLSWKHVGRVTWNQILKVVDHVSDTLWINNFSSECGVNDRIPVALTSGLHHSLSLICPNEFSLEIVNEVYISGRSRRRVRSKFDISGSQYNLVVTDPLIEQKYLNKVDGVIHFPEVLLCVSLTEPYYGYAYKLVAAVLTPK